ncbi:MAG: 4Fe-4S dicluster domain-containing protein [Planctomycetaceae bacterium]|nr:4Fe-4S dicluster domain-containing protein [Planctomycetaceae bacterium]
MTLLAALNAADATREVMWNISHSWLMYVLLVPTMLIAGYGVYRQVQKWRSGQPAARFDRPAERIKRVVKNVLLQQATLRDRFAGVYHFLLFWGMITLTMATIVVMIHHDFHIDIMRGRFYLYFQSLFVDVLGVLAMIGVAMLAVRRWLLRPKKLVYTDESTWLLILLFVILGTGFLLEGWRIAATNDPWGDWSPVGIVVSKTSLAVAGVETLKSVHFLTWWFHLALVFGLIAWAPYTKLLHVLTAPLNIYTANLDHPGGTLKQIDFEAAQSFGINSLEQFTWKDLLDLDACTECGRCTSVCPANTVGKQLSPRDIILDLQGLLDRSDLASLKAQGHGERPDEYEPAFPIIGTTDNLATEALFECTTCAACVEICPVSIEQMPKIVDLRRFQVMEQAEFPQQMQDAVSSLEERGHPFKGTQLSRVDWAAGMDFPTIEDIESPEVLLWVGCGGALVDRNQRSTRALANLLKKANVKFAILGREETCTGDPARRIGNEFLFETLATQNIETLKTHNIKHVLTSCPHCFNTFRNEYPKLGGEFEVMHHTTYLAKLIGEGRLKLDAQAAQKIVFHDPCYLGRHNGITDAPRKLLQQVSSQPLAEMEMHGRQSFCCGGGGGMSFVDEPADQRVNQERARQALATDAETVAVGCPFCTTMMEDGINTLKGDRKINVQDIAEVMWEAISSEAR